MYFFSLFSLSLFWEAFLHWFFWYISTNSMNFSCNFPYVVWPGSYPSSMNPFPLVLQMHFSIQSCIFMLHVVQAQIEVFSINHSKPEHSGLNPVNPGSNFRPVPVLTHDLSHLKYNIKFLSISMIQQWFLLNTQQQTKIQTVVNILRNNIKLLILLTDCICSL